MDSNDLATAYHRIDQFSEQMKQEMRANRHKGSWEGAHPEDILLDLHYHVAKLHVAFKRPKTTCSCFGGQYPDGSPKPAQHDEARCTGADRRLEYAADVANMAWMLVDRLGMFTPKPEAPEVFE